MSLSKDTRQNFNDKLIKTLSGTYVLIMAMVEIINNYFILSSFSISLKGGNFLTHATILFLFRALVNSGGGGALLVFYKLHYN